MNPYLVPGLEATPHAPLCPHLNKAHDTFYVEVDDTEKEFGRFQKTMKSVGRLAEGGGRLVVVTGEKGCGKTSLINRCIAWLRDELAEAQLKGEIFALADSAKPHQSIMLRMGQVITDLVDDLRDEQREVGPQHINRLERRIREIEDTSDEETHVTKVDRVYRYLVHDALPADRIAIIVLPPSSDLAGEFKNYADFARHPRIVFFAETDYVEDVSRVWPGIHMSDRMAPILLKVGLLSADDGWTYAHARQGSDSADPSFPRVSKETMRRVTGEGVVSIGRLHWLLHGVYEELVSQKTPGDSLPFREVSYDHIADYFFRLRFDESRNMS